MASFTVRRISEFDINAVTFSAVRKNTMGGKVVYLNGAGNSKLLFQLPQLRAPYGLSTYTDAASGKTSYSLSLSLDNPEIVAKFKELDDKVIEFVHANSVTCLGKQYNKEVMREALYKSPMAPGKGDYAPTLKLKMLTGPNGNFTAEAYDSNRKLVNLTPDTLEKGQGVLTIVEINQIWFIDNKFGISVRLQQMLLAPTNKLKGFGFIDQPSVEPTPSDAADGEESDEVVDDDDV
ncbi:hypothetical protein EBT25_05490 [bacterium]|nr:hypothetical protein [bacterium]